MNYVKKDNIEKKEAVKKPFFSKFKVVLLFILMLVLIIGTNGITLYLVDKKMDSTLAKMHDIESVTNNNDNSSGLSQETRKIMYNATVAISVKSLFSESQGSGVIIDKNHIITCDHVVGGNEEVTIAFANEDTTKGKVVATNKNIDLAVVEANIPEEFAPVKIISQQPQVGSSVTVVGNNFGLGLTMTDGIISATEREIQENYFIQTDAAINSGNSGGGLFDSQGNLIGIADKKVSKEGVDNIGFAVPFNVVTKFLTKYNIPYTSV